MPTSGNIDQTASTTGPGSKTNVDKVIAGVKLLQDKRVAEAIACFQLALEDDGNSFDLWNNLGVAWQKLGNHEQAIPCLKRAIEISAQIPAAHANIADSYFAKKSYVAALAHYKRAEALGMQPDQMVFRQARILQILKQYGDALQEYLRAVQLNPSHAEAFNNMGNVLTTLRQFRTAIPCYGQAIKVKPDYDDAYNNRGGTWLKMRQYQLALNDVEDALKINPKSNDAITNKGVVLHQLGRHDEAIAQFDIAISRDANYAEAHWNASLCLLQMGRFERGWMEYEWRDRRREIQGKWPVFECQRWDPAFDLKGKTLLIHAEQGLGDTLQFCRFVPLTANLGGRVIFRVPATLIELMKTLLPKPEVVSEADDLPNIDYECPLLSMPHLLQIGEGAFSATSPYLRVDETRVRGWQEALGAKTRLRIGVAWSGNPNHQSDDLRSMALSQLAPLFALDAEWVCLQKEVRDSDTASAGENPTLRMFNSKLNTFADTAALVDCMDIVISVDTSVAHLAGALGKKTFLLLAKNPDWRWLLNRSDSPWYPTMTLFRQDEEGQWPVVVERLEAEVRSLLSMRK